MHLALVSVATVLGAAAGLLVPRAAFRLSVPAGEPWRNTCPSGHPLHGVASGWLGPASCRQVPDCGRFGSATAAALGSAAASGALAAAIGWRPELLVWLALVPVASLLTSVDWRVHRLPDVITLPAAAGTLTLLAAAAQIPHHQGSFSTAGLGAVALATTFLLLFAIHPAGMGLGDGKTALMAGAAMGWYGWPALVIGALCAFTLGSAYGLALLLMRRADRRTAMPFGPMLLCGTLLGILWGTTNS
ncbi:prepilin peptidase [Streptomyces kronopolitis]|uniref:prepilin peptidase n=1 Tax=Streptomyces kronopolitis TaxID=1612435 RepID=UPI0036822BF8